MKRERGISYCQQRQGGKQHATINYNLKWQLARRWHGQHGGRGSTGAEAVEVVAAGARRHGGGGGDVRVGGPLFFCQLLLLSCSLWRHIIFYHIHMGIRSVCTYLRTYVVCLWSVNVGKGDTKVSRHSKNHVADIGPFGENLATFLDVADMSPTCRRHFQPRLYVLNLKLYVS